MKEIGIYIHIPFCMQKCYYCDFISFANKEDCFEKYINKLKKEITESKGIDSVIKTIYIGGGNPSCIDSKYIIEIMNQIGTFYDISKDVEVTLEVNPGTINEERLLDYKKAGINRISIGLQTCDNKLLKQIGRIHTVEEFYECFKLVRKVGFKNVNIDLMLGIPNQSLNVLKNTVNKVMELKPEHISIYSLIVEAGTVIAQRIEAGELKLPSEELERQMFWMIKELLEKNGYMQYEISNYAKKGYESKHNSDCWSQKEYLGFGLAAHSYYDKKRYSNVEKLEEYINENSFNRTIHEIQGKEDEMQEFVLLGLRKIEGVRLNEFKEKFNVHLENLYSEKFKKLSDNELIEINDESVKLTNKGIDLANQVWQEFC